MSKCYFQPMPSPFQSLDIAIPRFCRVPQRAVIYYSTAMTAPTPLRPRSAVWSGRGARLSPPPSTMRRRRSSPVPMSAESGNGSGRRPASGKYVVTTVRSANLRPASALRALVDDSVLSYLTNILPTPADCRLPPTGLGTLISRIMPNLEHSSRTSSQISGRVSGRRWTRPEGTHLRSRRCP